MVAQAALIPTTTEGTKGTKGTKRFKCPVHHGREPLRCRWLRWRSGLG